MTTFENLVDQIHEQDREIACLKGQLANARPPRDVRRSSEAIWLIARGMSSSRIVLPFTCGRRLRYNPDRGSSECLYAIDRFLNALLHHAPAVGA